MSKKLIITAIFIAFLTLSFGFVCPFLFSAKSDILVILGVVYSIIIACTSVVYYTYIKNDLKNKAQILILLIGVLPIISSCSKVSSGNVGIKVYLIGENKGVDSEVLGVGRYWIGMNEELYVYPTYLINYTYTKDATEGSPQNEEFTFQTKEGMECSVDLGVSVKLDETKIPLLFKTYRKGIDEIRSIVVRNTIRNSLNLVAGKYPVEFVYGEGKGILIDSVQKMISKELAATGIGIQKLYLIGSVRIPASVKDALDSKVKMTQDAQKVENAIQKEKAEAEILIVQSNARAESKLINARAEAESNKLISNSITQELISYNNSIKWNGVLPQYTGGPTPIINLK